MLSASCDIPESGEDNEYTTLHSCACNKQHRHSRVLPANRTPALFPENLTVPAAATDQRTGKDALQLIFKKNAIQSFMP
jgi:hypothetical protein